MTRNTQHFSAFLLCLCLLQQQGCKMTKENKPVIQQGILLRACMKVQVWCLRYKRAAANTATKRFSPQKEEIPVFLVASRTK